MTEANQQISKKKIKDSGLKMYTAERNSSKWIYFQMLFTNAKLGEDSG